MGIGRLDGCVKQFWRFSRKYLLRYKWWYALGFVLIAGTQALSVAIIETTKRAIDALSSGTGTAGVPLMVLTIVGFAVTLVVIRIGSRLLVFTPARIIEYDIRNDYYHRLLYLQRDFFAEHEVGDLVSRCSNDISFVRVAFGFGILQVANVALTFAFGFGAMVRMDWQMTVLLVLPMLVVFGIIQASIHYMFTFWRRSNVQLGELSSLTLATYKGISAIQNTCAEAAFERRFEERNDAYLNTFTVITRVRSYIMPLVQFVGKFSVFLVLWFVGPRVMRGALTIGELMAFLGYISMVMPPLLSLGWMLNVFNRSLPAMERLEEILLAKPNVLDVTELLPEQAPGRSVLTVRDLSHGFPRSADVMREANPFSLNHINFDLEPGKVLGIVGEVGSGKTALVESILRLNPIGEGRVWINGMDAAHTDLDRYRAHFAFAPQKAFLFSATLRENLCVALNDTRRKAQNVDGLLLDYLDRAGFDLDPEQFPQGLDTQVGEKGIMLSGGQRQRIALARALLKDADFYVLDDVLSAVDHETEKRIIGNLRRTLKDCALIIVSHRVSAVQWADEILVMDRGAVVDRGEHGQLKTRPGYYRDIVHAQSANGEEER